MEKEGVGLDLYELAAVTIEMGLDHVVVGGA